MFPRQLTLREFLTQEISSETMPEFWSITVVNPYPYAKAFDDLAADGQLAKPAELPFADPEAALAAWREETLKREIWDHIGSRRERTAAKPCVDTQSQ